MSLDAGSEEREGMRGGIRGSVYSSEDDVQRRRYALSHTGNWDWGDSQVRLYRSTLNRENIRSDGDTQSGPNRFTDTVLDGRVRSEEHTSELQSLMRISYAVFCLKKKKKKPQTT